MNFKTIQIQLGESIAWMQLNRPEVHNALNPELIKELTEAFSWLNDRDDVRIIVLKGNGKSFCAGADLSYMKEMANYSRAQNVADADKLANLFKTIYFCGKAVITEVHGACIGGANGLVAAADIVIAERQTRFAFSEVKLGITPATISPFVLQRIGMTNARELMLTGRNFSADEAKDFGLVTTVVDETEMIDTERLYIGHFLQASPDAIAECKQLLRTVSGTSDPYNDIYYYTSNAIAEQRVSKAGQEGMKAFLRKGTPIGERNNPFS